MTTNTAERRTLRFGSMDDLLADIEALDERGEVQSAGHWTAAQNVEHVARFIDASVDGTDAKASLALRLLGPFVKKSVLAKPMKPGFKLPTKLADQFVPPANVTWEDAVEHLRTIISRAKAEGMTGRSPVFGQLTHDEWVQMHCRHAELHFSFLS